MRVNNLLGDDPRNNGGRKESETRKERKKLKDMLLSELPWWTTRAPSCGETSGDSVHHAPDVPAKGRSPLPVPSHDGLKSAGASALRAPVCKSRESPLSASGKTTRAVVLQGRHLPRLPQRGLWRTCLPHCDFFTFFCVSMTF